MSQIVNPLAPAGADQQVQLNKGGALGASPNLSFESYTNELRVGGSAVITNTYPLVQLTATTDPPNNRAFWLENWGQSFRIAAYTDDRSALQGMLTLTRTGDLTVRKVILPGGQVQFPPTPNPSTDPNTQDDYREIDFTPWLSSTGGQSGQVYAQQAGTALKIGRLVAFIIRLDLVTAGTFAAGNGQIVNLPFVANAFPGVVHIAHWYFPGAAPMSLVSGYVQPFTSTIALSFIGGAGSAGTFGLDPALFTSGTAVYVGGHYFTSN